MRQPETGRRLGALAGLDSVKTRMMWKIVLAVGKTCSKTPLATTRVVHDEVPDSTVRTMTTAVSTISGRPAMLVNKLVRPRKTKPPKRPRRELHGMLREPEA